MRNAACWLLPVLLVASGCSQMVSERQEPETEFQSVDRGQAETVTAVVEMPGGTLHIRGGATQLMDGDFSYTSEQLRPEVSYTETALRGHLNVNAPGDHSFTSLGDDQWTVNLNSDVEMDLEVRMGAGEGDMKLDGMKLSSLLINMGAGQMNVDLTGGSWTRDCDVTIHGGVGELKIQVPDDVGVVADAAGGIGEINVRGLRKQGGQWVNDLYDKSPVTIRLDVKGGVGSITISSEG